jgi:hypothetical protein
VQWEGLGKLKIFNDLISSRTRDLLACSIELQSSMLPHTPVKIRDGFIIPHTHDMSGPLDHR